MNCLHEWRQVIHNRTNGSEEDGVEMEFRDAFKEGRGQRAARVKADEVPRKRRASHAADALSKACIVQVGAYGTDGRSCSLLSSVPPACACTSLSGR